MSTLKRIGAQRVIAAAIALLMLAWLWQASTLAFTVDGNPGPGFFPVWLSGIGFVLAMAVLVKESAERRRAAAAAPSAASPSDGHQAHEQDESPADGGILEERNAGLIWRPLTALLGLIGFFALIPVLGFVLGLTCYMLFVAFVLIRMPLIQGSALCLGTAVFVYVVFGIVFGVPFPTGLTGI